MNEQVLAEFAQQFKKLADFEKSRGMFDLKTIEGCYAHFAFGQKMLDKILRNPLVKLFPNEFEHALENHSLFHGWKLTDFFNDFRNTRIRDGQKYSRRKIKALARAKVASLKTLREYYQQPYDNIGQV